MNTIIISNVLKQHISPVLVIRNVPNKESVLTIKRLYLQAGLLDPQNDASNIMIQTASEAESNIIGLARKAPTIDWSDLLTKANKPL